MTSFTLQDSQLSRIRTAGIHFGIASLVLISAPVAMPPEYDQIRHWISELTADGTPNAWLGKLGFLWLSYAIWLVAEAMRDAWRHYERRIAQWVAWSLIPIAVFDHHSWISGENVDPIQNALHYVFATMYFVGLAALVGTRTWRGHESEWRSRFDYITLTLSVAIPVHMVTFLDYAGLLQRVGLTLIFAWIGLELWSAYKERLAAIAETDEANRQAAATSPASHPPAQRQVRAWPTQ